MKKLSYWARQHTMASRLLIALIYILLNALGILTGILLYETGKIVPTAFIVLLVLLAIVATFYYPSAKNKYILFTPAQFYVRQKTCDFLLGLCTFCMVLCISNRLNTRLPGYSNLHATISTPISIPADSAAKKYKSVKEFSESMKNSEGKPLSWKEKKKLLKVQIKGIKQSKDLSGGAKALLIFLSVLVALGLLALLAALSCSIGCSGSEVLAFLVGLVGTALIIFLLVRVIQRITGKRKNKVEESQALQ